MNKNELVSAVADAASISKGDAQSAVDAVFSVISGELKKGGDV
ncbi:HU family DNA-binding protein, partial [Mesorhizobium sp. BR1-1-5]|nr:HU family DNA-binding protein [Mesorhizobium sp. BR1-1-5]